MNGAHLHLLLNHFPIIGLTFAILILGIGLIRSIDGFVRAGLLIAVISGLLAVPTYLTGEPAEKILKVAAEFSGQDFIEEHEDAAFFAIWAMSLTGLAAAAGLFFSIRKNHIPKALMIAIVILHLFTLTVLARTNYLGGKISHPEVRSVNDQDTSPDTD